MRMMKGGGEVLVNLRIRHYLQRAEGEGGGAREKRLPPNSTDIPSWIMDLTLPPTAGPASKMVMFAVGNACLIQ
jgi:hypothetical protein